MRTPEERGRDGRWLVAAREARGYNTAIKALNALAAAGIKIGKSTYAEYEAGTKPPSRNHRPLLERFWGPPTETPDASPDLVKAIDAQTKALTELAAQVKALAERPMDAALPGEIAAAVALAVRDTLRAVGIGEATPQQ